MLHETARRLNEKLSTALRDAGMDAGRVSEVGAMAERAARLLPGDETARTCFVPGRIEFLGKHTDYCGGRSLVCTVNRGIVAAFSPRSDRTIGITLAGNGEHTEFQLSGELAPAQSGWTNYPMTVARRVARNFPKVHSGMDLVLGGDLPQAAGLSSSSALVIATFLALDAVNDLQQSPEYLNNIYSREDLGGYLGCVENGQNFGPLVGDRGVGTFGGSQDHTAILCGKPGRISRYGFCPVTFEADVPMPPGHVLVVMGSGVMAEKTGAARDAYNRASLAARSILHLWNAHSERNDPSVAAAVRSSAGAVAFMHALIKSAKLEMFPASYLHDRLTQFVIESESIIPDVTDALRDRDFEKLAAKIDLSQYNSQHLLGNQVTETIWLAAHARSLGAVAASAFGAGFGGSVWAMMPTNDAAAFGAEIMGRYRRTFPLRAETSQAFVTQPGRAAVVV